MITYGYGVAKLEAEIEKCDVLCANCHRREHYEIPDAVTPPGVTSAATLDLD